MNTSPHRMRWVSALASMLAFTSACGDKGGGKKAAPSSDPMAPTERLDSFDGAVTLHYPGVFQVQKKMELGVSLYRRYSDGTEATLGFLTVAKPNKRLELVDLGAMVTELARRSLPEYTEEWSKDAICCGSPAIEKRWRFRTTGEAWQTKHLCMFFKDAHAYYYEITVPEAHREDLSRLIGAMEETDFN